MTRTPVGRARSRKSKPFNVLPSCKRVGDKRRPLFGVVLSPRSGTWTNNPLLFITRARAVLSTRAKVLSQSKVSKFIPHARIYVTHLCPRGALACFQTPAWCRLDPGPRCSLPCPCLSALGTNKRDGTNGTERLVQEADVRRRHPLPLLLPPRSSPFLLTPSDTYNHSPGFDERPAPPSS